MTVRFLLGVFEAAVTPAFVIITSMWYNQTEQGRRMGYWLSCNGITLIAMAGIGYGLSGITNATIDSWKVLLLLLGLITVATSIFCYWYMPDDVVGAWFLNPTEKNIAAQRFQRTSRAWVTASGSVTSFSKRSRTPGHISMCCSRS